MEPFTGHHSHTYLRSIHSLCNAVTSASSSPSEQLALFCFHFLFLPFSFTVIPTAVDGVGFYYVYNHLPYAR